MVADAGNDRYRIYWQCRYATEAFLVEKDPPETRYIHSFTNRPA